MNGRTVFIDTAYLFGRADRHDQWHQAALDASDECGEARFVTSQDVLVEFLTGVRKAGQEVRDKAVTLVDEILADPHTEVVTQSPESFAAGYKLYRERPDQTYSMQDCISMSLMRARGITEILTSDGDFHQEGFVVLMRDDLPDVSRRMPPDISQRTPPDISWRIPPELAPAGDGEEKNGPEPPPAGITENDFGAEARPH